MPCSPLKQKNETKGKEKKIFQKKQKGSEI